MELKPEIQSIFTKNSLEFYVNGTRIELINPNPQWTLLDFLRSQHGLKGTKLGCGEGGCGACTVVLQTLEEGSIRHLAINACLFPLIGGAPIPRQVYDMTIQSDADENTVVGKHVITVEGLGNAENPHPLQERMAKLHGSQYVTCLCFL